MDYFIELFFSGLTRGSIYALIALGYTMVYGIIGLINFAHGEIYMIGAFTALIVSTVLSIFGFPLAGNHRPDSPCLCNMGQRLWLHRGKTCLSTPAKCTPAVTADLCHRNVHVSAELCSTCANF